MRYKVVFEHVPGLSPIDHVADELVQEAKDRIDGLTYPSSFRAYLKGIQALQGARMELRALSARAPLAFGVFRYTFPHVQVVVVPA